MSNNVLRQVLRVVHLVTGGMMVAFVYNSMLRESALFIGLLQWMVVPIMILSGLAMWQQARVGKFLRGLRGNDRKDVKR